MRARYAHWLSAAKDDVSSQASGGEPPPAPQGSPPAPGSPFQEHPRLAGSSWHRDAGGGGILSSIVPLWGHLALLEGVRTQPWQQQAGRTGGSGSRGRALYHVQAPC